MSHPFLSQITISQQSPLSHLMATMIEEGRHPHPLPSSKPSLYQTRDLGQDDNLPGSGTLKDPLTLPQRVCGSNQSHQTHGQNIELPLWRLQPQSTPASPCHPIWEPTWSGPIQPMPHGEGSLKRAVMDPHGPTSRGKSMQDTA